MTTLDSRIVQQSPEIRTTERLVRRRHKELPEVLAILFGHALDRRLASGRPPAAGRVVAARAEYLGGRLPPRAIQELIRAAS